MAKEKGNSNLMGALAYAFGFFGGLTLYLVKKDDKFVKFHAVQSMMFSVILSIVGFVYMIALIVMMFMRSIGMIITLIMSLVMLPISLMIVVLWFFLMWKAYQGEKFKLPIIGGYAESHSN